MLYIYIIYIHILHRSTVTRYENRIYYNTLPRNRNGVRKESSKLATMWYVHQHMKCGKIMWGRNVVVIMLYNIIAALQCNNNTNSVINKWGTFVYFVRVVCSLEPGSPCAFTRVFMFNIIPYYWNNYFIDIIYKRANEFDFPVT